jgi:hypothetical protein
MENSKIKKYERTLNSLYRKRDKALERVVEIYMKGEDADEDELNKALDVLTVAHARATFEFVDGSFSS